MSNWQRNIFNKTFLGMNNGTDSHSMINDPFQCEENDTSVNNKSFSLVLSLRINDPFSLQNYHRCNGELLSSTDDQDQTKKIPTSSLALLLARKPSETLNKTLEASSLNHRLPNTETAEFQNDYIPQWITSQTFNESSTAPNSITDERMELYKRSAVAEETDTSVPFTVEIEDGIPISAKQLDTLARREHRHQLQREIITLAKKAIKASYQKRYITKEAYKIIMKKVVTKATYSNRIDQKWIEKSIHAYVKKYRTVQ